MRAGTRANGPWTRGAPRRLGSAEEPPSDLYGLGVQEALCDLEPDEAAWSPDLLHPTPSASFDRRAAMRGLEFAFAAGNSAGMASGALEGAAIFPSRFDAACFERELFIDELIEGCLAFHIDGNPASISRPHLKRLICQPPKDPAVTAFRADILTELDGNRDLVQGIEKVYRHVSRLLALYDGSADQSRYAMPRWRLEILGELRSLFGSLQGPFVQATSGLSRLHTFGEHIRQEQGYQDLCALLDFEGDLAQADVRLRIGVDGRVRSLEIIDLAEHRTQPFYRGRLARLLWRTLMLLRGYQVRDTELVERWFDRVYHGVVKFIPALLQLRGDLEFYLAACHFADVSRGKGLEVCVPAWTDGQGDATRVVKGLFNPLLLAESSAPVPCDLDVNSFRQCCIVTGPNSGGKTRLLQALGLTQLLGQAGFFVPAVGALLRAAPGMFVSLSAEAGADHKEGRLGTELMRIRRLFENASPHSMVILDELCSGTNPSEGEEIFRLVVELLREMDPEVYITTHFLSFAAQLADQADALSLCFLQVDLDAHNLPTYQFVPGVASTSLARQTAARLGVSRDELLALIRRRR